MCTYNIIKNKPVSISLPLSFSEFGKKWTVTSSVAEMKMEKLQSRTVSVIKGTRSLALTYDCHITRGGKVGVHSNTVVLRQHRIAEDGPLNFYS